MKKQISMVLISALLVGITTTPASAQSFFGGALRSLVGRFLPIIEQHLGQILTPILDDYTGIVSSVVTDTFQSVVTGGGFNLDRTVRGALPGVARQVSRDTGLNESGLFRVGSGVIGGDGEQILDGGILILRDRFGRRLPGTPSPRNPNGSQTGGGTGDLPSGEIEETAPGYPDADPNYPDYPGPPNRGGTSGGTGSSGNPLPQAGPRGTSACAFSTTCVGSLPANFQQIFNDATGALGLINPNQVRGRIYDEASAGRVADSYAINAYTAARHVANEVDRELTRLSTQAHFSAEAQETRRQGQDAMRMLLEQKAELVSDGLQSESSQNVLKSLLSNQAILPDLSVAQIELQKQNLEDNQYLKLNTSNISESADWQRRIRDTELGAQAYSAMYEIFSAHLPGVPSNTPRFPTR